MLSTRERTDGGLLSFMSLVMMGYLKGSARRDPSCILFYRTVQNFNFVCVRLLVDLIAAVQSALILSFSFHVDVIMGGIYQRLSFVETFLQRSCVLRGHLCFWPRPGLSSH